MRVTGLRCSACEEPPRNAVGIGADDAEDVGPVGGPDSRLEPMRRSAECGLAAGCKQQHLIARVQERQRMRHHHDDAARVGELAQHRHHAPVERGVQARRRLVEHEKRRTGQQFHRDRHAFALPAGQAVDARRGVRRQLEFVEHRGDHLPAVARGGVGGHPKFRCEFQFLRDGEPAVHDVVLGHHADPIAQRRVPAVQIAPLERHHTTGRPPGTDDQLGERGLARARGADHRCQRARPGGERNPIQQNGIPLGREAHVAYLETAGRRTGHDDVIDRGSGPPPARECMRRASWLLRKWSS